MTTWEQIVVTSLATAAEESRVSPTPESLAGYFDLAERLLAWEGGPVAEDDAARLTDAWETALDRVVQGLPEHVGKRTTIALQEVHLLSELAFDHLDRLARYSRALDKVSGAASELHVEEPFSDQKSEPDGPSEGPSEGPPAAMEHRAQTAPVDQMTVPGDLLEGPPVAMERQAQATELDQETKPDGDLP